MSIIIHHTTSKRYVNFAVDSLTVNHMIVDMAIKNRAPLKISVLAWRPAFEVAALSNCRFATSRHDCRASSQASSNGCSLESLIRPTAHDAPVHPAAAVMRSSEVSQRLHQTKLADKACRQSLMAEQSLPKRLRRCGERRANEAADVAGEVRHAGLAPRADDAGCAHNCKSLDLIQRSMSDLALHLTASMIGEAGSNLSMMRAFFSKFGIPDLPECSRRKIDGPVLVVRVREIRRQR
jgi:hypothetical protein